jgi:hypothetical protein
MWLRSAILFWDDIHTIVPNAINDPYRTDDTRICYAEGYLKPLHCDTHNQILDELGNKIIESLDWRKRELWFRSVSSNEAFRGLNVSIDQTFGIENALVEVGIHPEKLSPELRGLALRFGLATIRPGKLSPSAHRLLRDFENVRIHRHKLSHFLRNVLNDEDILDREDGDWLMVDGAFASAYMSALASRLSKQVDLSPLTSDASAEGPSFRFMFDDLIDDSPNNATGAMVAVIMRSLRVDPSVSVDRIIRFRRDRADQYADFAGQITELKSRIENAVADDGGQSFEQAKLLYDRKIEPSLRALKRELDIQSIGSLWEGAFRALTISAPSASALAVFTNITGPALLGSFAALAAADIGVRSYLAGRKIRGGNPYSYLHDINTSFGLPDFGD